jgi:hypothetical protein
VEAKNTLYKQRFDSQAQPVGGVVAVGGFLDLTVPGFPLRLAADASGGYTLTATFEADFSGSPPVTSAIHFDATDTATEVVAPRTGEVLLLPLEGDRFVLFSSDSAGFTSQFLDSAGNPVGSSMPISSVPFAARELMDGSFVVFWNTSGIITAQRFDSAGTAVGSLLTLETGGMVPALPEGDLAAGFVPLLDGGFAAAWSAPGTAGDLDVFTQRFIELLDQDHAAQRARRKACLNSAKGMRGQERKAFMDACLSR